MHTFYFLLALFGFIGWETFWGYASKQSDENGAGSFGVGLIGGIFVLLVLGIIGVACWGLWSIT